MYAHTVPSRATAQAQGLLIDDAPEGQSLLNRWAVLFNDTFRALWEKSAEFASESLGRLER